MTSLTRSKALEALEDAFNARMESEFRNLADPYSDTTKEKSEAQERFVNGLSRTREAYEFAVSTIKEIFEE